jgi:hypothetical protein
VALIGGGRDLEANIRACLRDRLPTDRYASFDYCFNFFQEHRDRGNVEDLANGEMQHSYLELGFYLASWGMLRGGADLLQHSAKYLEPVVTAISVLPPEAWTIDVDRYSPHASEVILEVADRLRKAFPAGASETLVTKVMLGVFACVPALDRNVTKASGRRVLNRATLHDVGRFYVANADVIDRYLVPTIDFATGRPTSRRYTRAKVIDMGLFIDGGRR